MKTNVSSRRRCASVGAAAADSSRRSTWFRSAIASARSLKPIAWSARPGIGSTLGMAPGGTTIGILPGEDRAAANEWVDHVVVTGIGHARNLAVVGSGDAVIAVGGRWGTLAEIGFARVLGRRVVILETGWELEGVPRAESAEES